MLAESGARWIGGYANSFEPIPVDWTLDGDGETDGLLSLRADLDPASYVLHCADWLKAGATVIGGCCGTRPAHIKKMRGLINR